MTLSIGHTYPTRRAGEALVIEYVEWPLRAGDAVEFFAGILLATGRPVRWEPDGQFFGGLGNDPYDIILT